MSEILVVVGGQFGSEAKGHVTAQLVNKFAKPDADGQGFPVTNIRVAGPNAGHTVYDAEGQSFAFRQLPVGAVLGDPGQDVTCLIAAGSEIDLQVLHTEIQRVAVSGHRLRLLVDGNATVIEEGHKQEEALVDLIGKLGSTGKGIGAARAARVMRTAKRVKDYPGAVQALETWSKGRIHVTVTDTRDYLAAQLPLEGAIIVEGTQGYGLGVHTDHYPKTTSSDARAIDFLAMAGISPWHQGVTGTTVVVVCRVYPIRVAGNSGELKNETTWEALGLPEERTTVTQKVRRVGDWDAELVAEAVRANGGGHWNPIEDALNRLVAPEQYAPPVLLALTMVDQKIPELAGFEECENPKDCQGHPQVTKEAARKFEELLKQVQEDAGAPVGLVTTGPRTAVWL